MLYSTPNLELSIYSTCQRISQKLMRNVTKFLALIYEALKTPKMPVIRSNMEEVVLQGPDGGQDVRIVNSYPSKVSGFFIDKLIIFIVIQLKNEDYESGRLLFSFLHVTQSRLELLCIHSK